MVIIFLLVIGFGLMCAGAVKVADDQMSPADWERAYAHQREVTLHEDNPQEWLRQRIARACEVGPEDCSRYVR